MSNRPSISTVEIFHDEQMTHFSTTEVENGVSTVNDIVKNLEIVNNSRAVRIPGEDIPYAKVRWPQFRADYNLILTERRLHRGDSSAPDVVTDDSAGVAFRGLVKGVALVDVRFPETVAGTTAHEMAHLYDVKTLGAKLDPENPGHCIDQECLMHHKTQPESISRRGVGRILGNMPGRASQERVRREEAFCGECAGELGQKAYFLALRRSGQFVPDFFFQ